MIKGIPTKTGGRRSSRLAAVQALYQMEMNGTAAKPVILEFIRHRHGVTIDEDQFANFESDFFADIVQGVEDRLNEIDDYLKTSLTKDWKLERIESVARAVLRAGTYEIIARPDVPTSVIISEYVDVTKAFFDDTKPGFVNGVLDKLAQQIRN
ncbi:MAG: transcription antitermination factor NusB [Proteobacteria bacterium]|jgi:transcription antitermination protein NusB|nr:transcription antitermination factor NusB [Pseudomonadota bacterium]